MKIITQFLSRVTPAFLITNSLYQWQSRWDPSHQLCQNAPCFSSSPAIYSEFYDCQHIMQELFEWRTGRGSLWNENDRERERRHSQRLALCHGCSEDAVAAMGTFWRRRPPPARSSASWLLTVSGRGVGSPVDSHLLQSLLPKYAPYITLCVRKGHVSYPLIGMEIRRDLQKREVLHAVLKFCDVYLWYLEGRICCCYKVIYFCLFTGEFVWK